MWSFRRPRFLAHVIRVLRRRSVFPGGPDIDDDEDEEDDDLLGGIDEDEKGKGDDGTGVGVWA